MIISFNIVSLGYDTFSTTIVFSDVLPTSKIIPNITTSIVPNNRKLTTSPLILFSSTPSTVSEMTIFMEPEVL